MIKLFIGNQFLYRNIIKIQRLRHIIYYDYTKLHKIDDETLFYKAVNPIQLSNGTFKKTEKNRFTDINEELVNSLRNDVEYDIHDIAVSDGITSVELYNLLKTNSIKNNFHISDKYSKIYYFKNKLCKIFTESNNTILFYNLLNIYSNKNTKWKFLISKLLGIILDRFSIIRGKKTEVLLLNPATLKLIKTKKMSFFEHDIFQLQNNSMKFDIIRCMNILNPKYFSDHQIRTGIKNIKDSLKEDGILIVGRTSKVDSKNYASFFVNKNGELLQFKQINGGSEVSHLIN